MRLHQLIKHTNQRYPHSDYVSEHTFPTQDPEKVGEEFELEFFDTATRVYGERDELIPAEEDSRKTKDTFLCLRYDTDGEDMVRIYISENMKYILVHTSHFNNETHYLQQDRTIPIGIKAIPVAYPDREAYIFSIEASNVGHTIIIEYLDENTCRFVLDTEVEYEVEDWEYQEIEEQKLDEIRGEMLDGKMIYIEGGEA